VQLISNLNRLLVIGLPEAGKTTFLAALWHVLESGEVPEALTSRIISNEAKHLNTIRDEWLRYKPVGRTVPGIEQTVSLLLQDENEKDLGEVTFPDLSGESFRAQWVERHWTVEYANLVKASNATMLFINAGNLKEPFSIADIQRWTQAASINNDEPTEKTTRTPWSSESVPTQVQLVGLLQFIQGYIPSGMPLRLAIIISAWDFTKKNGMDLDTPDEWLRKRLPYLAQFLLANDSDFEFQAYGVSAQGGDISKSADREKLQEHHYASERILIEGHHCAPHDITEPIRWSLRLRSVKPNGT